MYGIFALLGAVGTLAASFVPETYREDFPECIADMENRKYHPYFSWFVWKRKSKQEKYGVDNEACHVE